MEDFANVLGIDVSYKKLNIYCTTTQKCVEISNDESTIAEHLKPFEGTKTLVLYEATGIYSNKLLKVCNKLQVTHFQIHPVQLKQVSCGMGKLNKTDELDAKAIALLWHLMLQHMGTLTTPTTNDMKELLNYLSSINSIKRLEIRYENLIHKTKNDWFSDDALTEFYEAHIKELEDKTKEIFAYIEAKLIAMWHKERLDNLETIPWLGRHTVLYLVVFFLDLVNKGITKEDKKKMVAYTWLNPIQEQSWTSVDRSRISKKWKSMIRHILYMPMMNWYRRWDDEKYANTNMGQFFGRMRTKFESPTNKRWASVITAMMKKTLLVAWGLFHNNTAYNRQ